MGSPALLLSLPINYSHRCNSDGLRWTLCWVAGWGFAANSVQAEWRSKNLSAAICGCEILKASSKSFQAKCFLSPEDWCAVSGSLIEEPASVFLTKFTAGMETGMRGWKMGLSFFLETGKQWACFIKCNGYCFVLFIFLPDLLFDYYQ